MENSKNSSSIPIPILNKTTFTFLNTNPINAHSTNNNNILNDKEMSHKSSSSSYLTSSSFSSESSDPVKEKPKLPYRTQSLNHSETKRIAEKWGFSTVRRRSHTISNDTDLTSNINQLLQRSKSPMRDMILNGQFL
ncbi:hypothetical protein K502DRAFT_323709, partial [Neoconidiobolus thromboides FSU 785]